VCVLGQVRLEALILPFSDSPHADLINLFNVHDIGDQLRDFTWRLGVSCTTCQSASHLCLFQFGTLDPADSNVHGTYLFPPRTIATDQVSLLFISFLTTRIPDRFRIQARRNPLAAARLRAPILPTPLCFFIFTPVCSHYDPFFVCSSLSLYCCFHKNVDNLYKKCNVSLESLSSRVHSIPSALLSTSLTFARSLALVISCALLAFILAVLSDAAD
jgi:hypothetical protein